MKMNYDVIVIGAGPGGIFSAYELVRLNPNLKVAVFESGHALSKRHCPIDGVKVKSCLGCKPCAIMNGFGGAGAFSDGKYNITNSFGGTLHEYVGKAKATELMEYVDKINLFDFEDYNYLEKYIKILMIILLCKRKNKKQKTRSDYLQDSHFLESNL